MSARWTTQDFPVGFLSLHPDRGINFQLNRLYNFSNDPVLLAALRDCASAIGDYDDLARSLEDLGRSALAEGHTLRAALCFRGAEFALPAGNAQRSGLRHEFIALSNAYYGIDDTAHHTIPFLDTTLSAYRFGAQNPKGTIVFLNGFDGYIEELTRVFLVFRDAGYDVIAFDGPGQGAVLEETGTPMTPTWEKPPAPSWTTSGSRTSPWWVVPWAAAWLFGLQHSNHASPARSASTSSPACSSPSSTSPPRA